MGIQYIKKKNKAEAAMLNSAISFSMMKFLKKCSTTVLAADSDEALIESSCMKELPLQIFPSPVKN